MKVSLSIIEKLELPAVGFFFLVSIVRAFFLRRLFSPGSFCIARSYPFIRWGFESGPIHFIRRICHETGNQEAILGFINAKHVANLRCTELLVGEINIAGFLDEPGLVADG